MKCQIYKHQNKNTIMIKNTIFTILAIVCVFACGEKKTESETEATPTIENTTTLTDAQIKNAGIVTGKMEQKEVSSTLKLNGKIDVPPQNLVSISVPMGGYLKYTKLLEGMYVSKGQVLCVVEDQQYIQLQEDYLLAKAKIGYAKAEFERQRELNRSKASSDKVYQQVAYLFPEEKQPAYRGRHSWIGNFD